MWEIWKQLLLEVLSKHAPLQTKRIRSRKTPWVTNDIKNLINTRDSLKRKAVITNVENEWHNYKIARNKVNIKLRKTKRDYFSNKIDTSNYNFLDYMQNAKSEFTQFEFITVGKFIVISYLASLVTKPMVWIKFPVKF